MRWVEGTRQTKQGGGCNWRMRMFYSCYTLLPPRGSFLGPGVMRLFPYLILKLNKISERKRRATCGVYSGDGKIWDLSTSPTRTTSAPSNPASSASCQTKLTSAGIPSERRLSPWSQCLPFFNNLNCSSTCPQTPGNIHYDGDCFVTVHTSDTGPVPASWLTFGPC